MGYFIFKDRNSKEFGPVERTKMLMRNKQTLNITNIPFGTPVMSWSGHESGSMQFTIGIKDINNTDVVDDLLGWLTGEGPLITSIDTGKYMWAYCNAEIIPNPIGGKLATVAVTFVTEPYRYAVDNPEIKVTMTSKSGNLKEGNINNPGNTECEPKFRLTGSGTVKLWLNHIGIEIENVSGGCIVDVQTRRVKDQSGNIILNRTIGDPTNYLLKSGANYFETSDNVSEVYVTKNARWL